MAMVEVEEVEEVEDTATRHSAQIRSLLVLHISNNR